MTQQTFEETIPQLGLKSTISMPVLSHLVNADKRFHEAETGNGILHNGMLLRRSPNIERSLSMSNIDSVKTTWQHLIQSIPFMAIPGVSHDLHFFRRTISNSSMRRMLGLKELPTLLRLSSLDLVEEQDSAPQKTHKFLEQPSLTLSLGLAMSCAVLSSFQVGFNSSAMNAPENVIKHQLQISEFLWSVAVSVFAIGGLFGSYLGGRLADKTGRKNFLVVNNVLFIAGGLLESLSYDVNTLIIARFLLGAGSGASTVVVPIYLGEIAPADLRGTLGTANQFALVIGILVAVFFGKYLGGETTWRFLLGLPVLPACLQLIFSPLLLESPLWLVSKDTSRALAQAEDILEKLRGEDDVTFEIEIMKRSRRDDVKQQQTDHSMTRLQLLRQHSRALIIGLVLQIGQQFSGINGVFYYSTSFFANAGVSDPWFGSLLASGVNVLATAIALYLMDIAGRRLLLMVSSLGMAAAAVLLTVALYNISIPAVPSAIVAVSMSLVDQPVPGLFPDASISPNFIPNNPVGFPVTSAAPLSIAANVPNALFSYVCIAGVLLYVTLFELGLGPIPWLIGAEIYPSQIRATAMTLSSAVNWGANFLVGLTFPHINRYLGWKTFFPYGIVCIAIALFTMKLVPETKGKSLAQIQLELLSDPQASKWRYGTFADSEEHENEMPSTSAAIFNVGKLLGIESESDLSGEVTPRAANTMKLDAKEQEALASQIGLQFASTDAGVIHPNLKTSLSSIISPNKRTRKSRKSVTIHEEANENVLATNENEV